MRKKILFLHPNFPGQFKHIAKHFANKGHDVLFLCQTHYGRNIPGVKRFRLKGKLGIEILDSQKLNAKDRAYRLAEQYLEAFKELGNRGWYPELIISHSAWGCGVYAKQYWTKSYQVSYVEWWFNLYSTTYSYDENNHDLGLSRKTAIKHLPRNALISLELISANKLVSPTQWQRSQLPNIFKDNCRVVFDGIDPDKFYRLNDSQLQKKEYRVITYGTRGMEPMRAFPQFIRSIPSLSRLTPDVTIEIAGNNEINYGGTTPKEGSWKQWALNYLKNHNCLEKVKWMGHLSEDKYISWLQNSDCHVYLTHPYVASWSLVEAMLACRKLVASDVEPVREFFNKKNMVLVDHRSTDSIIRGITYQLNALETGEDPEETNLVDRLKIGTCLASWESVTHIDVDTRD